MCTFVKKNDMDKACIEQLIRCFNNRENFALERIYLLWYDDFYYFSSKLYKNTGIESGDVVQDVFLKIWERKKLCFDSLEELKGYMYVSIRNGFYDYIAHKNVVNHYLNSIKSDDDYFISQIIETETLSMFNKLTEFLPQECAKVFRFYMEGYEIKEIVQKLGKSQSTIYNQRREAINVLKKLKSKNIFFIITIL